MALGMAALAGLLAVANPHLTVHASGSLTQSWSYTVHTGSGSATPSSVSAQPLAGATVADLFGNGHKEIVAGFPDGSIWVLDATTGQPLPGWPKYLGATTHSNPTVADLNNDGHDEIIATSETGWVYVWNADGSLYPGWPQHTHPGASNVSPGNFSAVAVGDLFGDGNEELVASSWDQHLWAWNKNGAVLPGFPIHVYDTGWDTPTLVDLEGRGQLDIVVGFDSSGPPWDPWPKGGEMWAFRPTGCEANVYADKQPCTLPGWPHPMDQTPWASSAAGDLLNNGNNEIVEGTGLNFPTPAGQYVNAYNAAGSNYGLWPRFTGGQNFASPAIGDLFGTGQRDVVEASFNGDLYAWDGNGNALAGWPVSVQNGYFMSDPIIAPVNSTQNGVWVTSGSNLDAYNNGGQLTWSTGGLGYDAWAAPTVADLGNGQLSVVTVDQATGANNSWDVRAFAIPGTARMLAGAWPMFHGNQQLSGTLAPTATMNAPSATQSSTQTTLSWSLDAGSIPAQRYVLWVRDQSQSSWQRYGSTSATSMPFVGLPGHAYSFTVQAESQSAVQDAGYSTSVVSTTFAGNASRSTPFRGMYGVDGSGNLAPLSSAPLNSGAYWGEWDIARDVVVDPSGAGGYVLDGFGGLHPFGDAPAVTTTFYQSGWDIARAVVLRSDGHSGYVLDGWGGLHPFGTSGDMPPAVDTTGYWYGWDIARDAVLRSDGQSGYVLDGWGGIHPFGVSGDVAPAVNNTGYWPGWDIAHRFTLAADGQSGYVLDGWGGVHPFGVSGDVPSAPSTSGYWYNWDIARGIVLVPGSSSQGYVMDAWGGAHPFGGAPAVDTPGYNPGDDFRGFSVA